MDSHLIANNPTSGHPPHYKRSYPSHLTSELNIIRSTGENQCNLAKNLRSAHHPSLMINLTTPKILKILYPPMYSIPHVLYPRVQAKTPEICKIPGVLWPALYGTSFP